MLDGFRTANYLRLDRDQLIEEIKKFILENKKAHYKILVGTDSEYNEDQVDFVSVVVVHRVGNGARYFWKRHVESKIFGLRERLWHEALLSLNISQDLLKFATLDKRINFSFELHLDLGTTGKSSSVVKEIINLIRGYGLEVKIKPESYAASKIADRLI